MEIKVTDTISLEQRKTVDHKIIYKIIYKIKEVVSSKGYYIYWPESFANPDNAIKFIETTLTLLRSEAWKKDIAQLNSLKLKILK